MIDNDIQGVDFICANTDVQALRNISARTIIQLGHDLTKGLGAGANPEVGRQAALADRERIAESLKGADLIFITAGMGGGTGDRKSTRLNSSHVRISYAVFCLKKKKKNCLV